MEYKRFVALEKNIKEIDPETNRRVRIMGVILNKAESSIFLDDGSGSVRVFTDAEELEKLKEKQFIRVIGRVLPTPDGFDIQAEAVQDMTKLDVDTFKKVRELWKNAK